MVLVAVIQMESQDEVATNLARAGELIADAAAKGATFCQLPENFALMSDNEQSKLAIAEDLHNGPIQQQLQQWAKDHSMHILAGSLPIKTSNPKKVYSSSLLYSAEGELLTHYEKIHLFDVAVSQEERYEESATVEAGEHLTVAKTAFAVLGLSICYDLRFPEMYRYLLSKGANVLCVPSAFTEKTGRAHWEVLLRARAIENLSFVLAANQGGKHPGGRNTYGHSMIISPWGEVLAQCEYGEAVLVAELDINELNARRQQFPVLDHRRIH